jgi:hypothetical protein
MGKRKKKKQHDPLGTIKATERQRVSFHEAGHAVIASLFDFQISDVDISGLELVIAGADLPDVVTSLGGFGLANIVNPKELGGARGWFFMAVAMAGFAAENELGIAMSLDECHYGGDIKFVRSLRAPDASSEFTTDDTDVKMAVALAEIAMTNDRVWQAVKDAARFLRNKTVMTANDVRAIMKSNSLENLVIPETTQKHWDREVALHRYLANKLGVELHV